MEKNIHDNEFDDYVRRSFDSYEELPADDMWERVEVRLEPEDKKRRPVIWWWVSGLAAAAIGISGLINIKSGAAPQLEVPSVRVDARTENPKQPTVSVSQEHTQKTNTKVQEFGNKNRELPHIEKPQVLLQVKKPSASTNVPVNNTQVAVHQTAGTVPILTDDPVSEAGNNVVINTGLNVSQDSTKLAAIASENDHTLKSATAVIEKQTPFDPVIAPYLSLVRQLPHTQPVVQHIENQTFTPYQVDFSSHTPHKKVSRFYAGVSFTPLRFTDKTHFTPPVPGRTRVASFTQKAQPSADWWLKAGGSVTRRWGWESGIGYRSVSRRAMHFPRFRFQQGVLTSAAPSRNYDFTYNLDTYGGSAEVTVRMEQQDNNTQVSPNEAISLRVMTQENVELIRVPLLLTAQFGKGKLKTVLKGGVTGSYILSSQIDFRSRISTSTRFRAGNVYTVYPELNNRFFLGYQVSAGLSYRVFPQWSIVMDPEFSGDFSRKTNASTKLPALRAYGINVGVNHHF